MPNLYNGVDEIRDSQGRLFTNLGFGQTEDWERIARREFSGATTVDIFWDDDTYDEIEVVAFGLTPGTDARDLRFRLSTDGSTFISTANYTWARWGVNSAGASSAGVGTNETSFMGVLSLGTGTDEVGAMELRIMDVSNTTRKKMLSWKHSSRQSAGLIHSAPYSGQMNANNNSIRGIQLLGELSATISGTVIVRGRRKFTQSFGGDSD